MSRAEDEPGQLKAFYTVPELARMAGVSRWTMARRLEVIGVPFRNTGRWRVVYLADLKRIDPDLWLSITSVESLRDLA